MGNKKLSFYNKLKLKNVILILLLILILLVIGLISNPIITGMIVKNNSGDSNCMEFKENILWSSEYNKLQESIKYQVWYPKYNCSDIGSSNCFLENIEVKTRFLYLGENEEVGEGNIQISEPDESICNNPEKGVYLKYLSSEKLKGESKSLDRYCGEKKKINDEERCIIETPNYKDYARCYGIKVYSSQEMLVDALEIKYSLCKEVES